MPEMIRFLTKKFSSHSLTEVKPAEHFSLQGHNPNQDQDFKERNDNADKKSLDGEKTCLESLSEGEAEDEEISTINLSNACEGKSYPVQKHSPKSLEGESSSSRFPSDQRLKQSALRHITPPLRQFEMRLPDIEIERKHPVTIKPRKCIRGQNNQLLKSLERHSPHLRRPAFQEVHSQREPTRPSAFIRIPHIEVAKIHPRPEKLKEKRSSKDFSPLAEKIVISKPAPPPREVTTKCGQETSHSDSEISETRSTDNLDKPSSVSIRRNVSFSGKKSPTPSLSMLERGSHYHHQATPPLRIGTLTTHRHSPSPPLRERHTPSPPSRVTPPSRDVITRDMSRDVTRDLSRDVATRDRHTPSPRFEYKCFTKLISSAESDSETHKFPTTLLENVARKFVPIPDDRKRRHKEDEVLGQSSTEKSKLNRIRECSRSPPNKLNIERISHGSSISIRESWDRTDVEMVDNSGKSEQQGTSRNGWHRDRLNSAYNNDLKRKYSVIPVDEEVRSLCATNSSSNFKAFILSTNTSQSGSHHRTIDISVMQPNKRVCCTDSPPSLRRPSINVEKMAQTVLIRRPVVRKAGASNRVWSTKEDSMIRRPIPTKQPSNLIPTSTT